MTDVITLVLTLASATGIGAIAVALFGPRGPRRFVVRIGRRVWIGGEW